MARPRPQPPVARLRTDLATLVRLAGGRDPQPSEYQLVGLSPADLVVYS